jgi:CRISPR/Cas system Type II protein with McrA/HNH and RuvC-like nuclease domain
MDEDTANVLKELREESERGEEWTYQEFWNKVSNLSSRLLEIHPNKRISWRDEVKKDLYHSQDGLCPLCGLKLEYDSIQVDHIVPYSCGGGNESTNLQLTHAECNNKKSAKVDPLSWAKYLEDLLEHSSKFSNDSSRSDVSYLKRIK